VASATLRAVLWMGGTLLSFSAMPLSVRELLAAYGTFQILFCSGIYYSVRRESRGVQAPARA
jgi:hypothetical protein